MNENIKDFKLFIFSKLKKFQIKLIKELMLKDLNEDIRIIQQEKLQIIQSKVMIILLNYFENKILTLGNLCKIEKLENGNVNDNSHLNLTNNNYEELFVSKEQNTDEHNRNFNNHLDINNIENTIEINEDLENKSEIKEEITNDFQQEKFSERKTNQNSEIRELLNSYTSIFDLFYQSNSKGWTQKDTNSKRKNGRSKSIQVNDFILLLCEFYMKKKSSQSKDRYKIMKILKDTRAWKENERLKNNVQEMMTYVGANMETFSEDVQEYFNYNCMNKNPENHMSPRMFKEELDKFLSIPNNFITQVQLKSDSERTWFLRNNIDEFKNQNIDVIFRQKNRYLKQQDNWKMSAHNYVISNSVNDIY